MHSGRFRTSRVSVRYWYTADLLEKHRMCPILVHSALFMVKHGMCPVLVHSAIVRVNIGTQWAREVKQGMLPVLMHSGLVWSNMVCVLYWCTVHLLGKTWYVSSIGAQCNC